MNRLLAFAIAIHAAFPNTVHEPQNFALDISKRGLDQYGPILHFKLTNHGPTSLSLIPIHGAIDQASMIDEVTKTTLARLDHCPPLQQTLIQSQRIPDHRIAPSFLTIAPGASIEIDQNALFCHQEIKPGMTITGTGFMAAEAIVNGEDAGYGYSFHSKFTISI